MRVLDLYCCAGGAARGYQLAGLEVTGVDIVPRPNYCGDEFHQWDAIEFLALFRRKIRETFDLIHTSPPCQEGSSLLAGTHGNRPNPHPQLVPETRRQLELIGLPYVIEQPTSNRRGLIRRDLTLCMDMFPVDPPRVFRHRSFELSGLVVPQPGHVRHNGRLRGWRHGVKYEGDYIAAYGNGGGKGDIPEMQHAMGIDWTSVREELTEAIPPAYTKWIGLAFMGQSDGCE